VPGRAVTLICQRLHRVERLARLGAEEGGKSIDGDYQVPATSLLGIAVAGEAGLYGCEVEGFVLIETGIGTQLVRPVCDIGESPSAQKERHLGLRSRRQVALRYLRDDAVPGGSPGMRGRG